MENTDITIEGTTAIWVMPPTQGKIGGTYTGTFQFRCFLDPIRLLQAGREYRELLGKLAEQASDTEGNLAFALTQLKHRILKAPPFWTSTAQDGAMAGNLGDLNVIILVLDSAIRAENMFNERIEKERESILDRSIKVGEAISRNEEAEGEE